MMPYPKRTPKGSSGAKRSTQTPPQRRQIASRTGSALGGRGALDDATGVALRGRQMPPSMPTNLTTMGGLGPPGLGNPFGAPAPSRMGRGPMEPIRNRPFF